MDEFSHALSLFKSADSGAGGGGHVSASSSSSTASGGGGGGGARDKNAALAAASLIAGVPRSQLSIEDFETTKKQRKRSAKKKGQGAADEVNRIAQQAAVEESKAKQKERKRKELQAQRRRDVSSVCVCVFVAKRRELLMRRCPSFRIASRY